MSNNDKEILSVSELNRRAKYLLEDSFSFVWLEGEISNLACPGSGHWYFTLKDRNAQVRCAMFRNRNQRLKITPNNGDQIIVRAKVSLYEGRGEFQLIIEHIEPAGDGALLRAFEELKKRLDNEGLFKSQEKKPLPSQAAHIGVITSPSGAAVHDILTVLKRRFPAIEVSIIPTAVQGEGAARAICNAIEIANLQASTLAPISKSAPIFSASDQTDLPPIDVLIVSRGGGSLEDLQAFNEEQLARAIYASQLPIVSAVGHEVDFTIADFVADARAATPSAAAEMLSPNQHEWQQQLETLETRLTSQAKLALEQAQQRLSWVRKRLRHPGHRLQEQAQRLDDLELHLKRTMQIHLLTYHKQTENLANHVLLQSPIHAINNTRQKLQNFALQLNTGLKNTIALNRLRLQNATQLLDTVNPLATLNRGYSILATEKNTIVRNSTEVKPGDKLNARLATGSISCQVTDSFDEPQTIQTQKN